MRFLPSTLQVAIEERAPYAIWQKDGQTYVVDDEGVVLTRALRDAYSDLPFVVGDGAGKSASQLFAVLVRYPELREKMLAAIRVGDRRWTLKLKSGVEVMLPDDNVDEALTSLARLEREHGVLEKDIAAVDLRLLDRVTVRLHDTASTAPADGNASQDLPTASTKGTKIKGKT
jgi:cell division protein FtsQ